MILISLNVRGVGGAPKFISLKSLLDLVKLDIFLVQETMVCGNKARKVFSKLLPLWKFCAVDSNGLSGSLLSAWNPKKDSFDAFSDPCRNFVRCFCKGSQ